MRTIAVQFLWQSASPHLSGNNPPQKPYQIWLLASDAEYRSFTSVKVGNVSRKLAFNCGQFTKGLSWSEKNTSGNCKIPIHSWQQYLGCHIGERFLHHSTYDWSTHSMAWSCKHGTTGSRLKNCFYRAKREQFTNLSIISVGPWSMPMMSRSCATASRNTSSQNWIWSHNGDRSLSDKRRTHKLSNYTQSAGQPRSKLFNKYEYSYVLDATLPALMAVPDNDWVKLISLNSTGPFSA